MWIAHEAKAALTIQMPAEPEEYAAQIYGRLHELDHNGLDWVAVELPPETRDWAAIRDRLTRAAY
jgi:L-threonylcarbamoyladenylate synthase